MSLGKQEIYRERTFGSYPTVHEIKRADRRSERDSLVKLLRSSSRQRSDIGTAVNAHSTRSSHSTNPSKGRLTNLLILSNDSSSPLMQYSDPSKDVRSKFPPVNDLHLRTLPHPVKSSLNPAQHTSSATAHPMALSAPFSGSIHDPFRRVENLNTHFRRSKSMVRRHFWISPEWLSEGLTVKRLHLENRTDPMKFGWI